MFINSGYKLHSEPAAAASSFTDQLMFTKFWSSKKASTAPSAPKTNSYLSFSKTFTWYSHSLHEASYSSPISTIISPDLENLEPPDALIQLDHKSLRVITVIPASKTPA